MAGTWTVGRLGADVDMAAASRLQVAGTRYLLSGKTRPDTAADGRTLRDQILGLDPSRNRDEPVVPVTFSWDDTMDGYYRVLSTSCDDPLGTATRGGERDWSIELERIPNRRPPISSVLAGVVLDNDHSIDWSTGARGSWGIPNAAAQNARRTWSSTDDETRTGDSGSVYYFTSDDVIGSILLAQSRNEFTVAPADYYDGACTIEADMTEDGAGWVPVIGNEFPLATFSRTDTDYYSTWRMTNGLVRVSGYQAAAGYTVLRTEHYDGASWETSNDVELKTGAAGNGAQIVNSVSSVTVNRNGPETCAVTIVGNTYVIDLVIRRGVRTVSCSARDVGDSEVQWYIQGNATTSTALTDGGGVRLTSNDGNGNRWVLMSPEGHTSPSGGDIQTTATDLSVFRFGLGCEVDGSSATDPSDADSEAEAYFGAQSERQWVRR